MGVLILILGGARSGKSRFAQKLAEERGAKRRGSVVYLATAQAKDAEMRERIARHRLSRPASWKTIEEPLKVAEVLHRVEKDCRVVIIDCLTLLISNILVGECKSEGVESADPSVGLLEMAEGSAQCSDSHRDDPAVKILGEAESIIQAAGILEADTIIVSNEVGLGVVPPSQLGRMFRDLAGLVNQRVAQAADEVYFLTAGLSQRLK